MGVVYYSNYLVYFELGRTELMRSRGLPYSELENRGMFMAVTEAYCKYRGPASYDDLLQIRTSIDRLTRTRVYFRYEVDNAETGAPVAEGWTVLACMDSQKNPVEMSADLRERLLEEA